MELPICQRRRALSGLLGAVLVGQLLVSASSSHASDLAKDDYASLVTTFEEYWEWRKLLEPRVANRFSSDVIARRQRELADLQLRLDAIDPTTWTPSRKVDFLVVRSELDQQDFVLHVTRPWARDPVFLLSDLLDIAFTPIPATGDSLGLLRDRLRAVPVALASAKSTLDSVASDYADLAIQYLQQSDGVENRYPSRTVLPLGVIGWYDDLLQRVTAQQPALVGDVERAKEAVLDFHSWLVANRPQMDSPAGVGERALDWYLRHGLLMPYTSAEAALLCKRELDRLWAFYGLERFRNRDLPELQKATSAFDYGKRVAEADKLVRTWIANTEFMTIPAFVPSGLEWAGDNVPWIERDTPPNFWEQIQFRDPIPDHLHAVIPGHKFDDQVRQRLGHPIRSKVRSHARWQGWAVYLEEGPMQAGILETRPRSRELIYVFGIWRAARCLGDVYGQWNDMRAEQIVDWWLEVTPLLDRQVARKYAHLRPLPGHGLDYTIGAVQMFQLSAEKRRQLGEDFGMREFHDELMSKGQIPFELIRYEMLGDERIVAPFFRRTSLHEAEIVEGSTSPRLQ